MAAADPPRAVVEQRLEELHAQLTAPGAVDLAGARYFDPARGYTPIDETDETDETGDAADHRRLGICIAGVDGEVYGAGEWETGFALQSISKVFTYAAALADNGRERVLERVGVDPSGEAYNAIEFDERHHRPYNPMVNAGALVTADLVRGGSVAAKSSRILDVLRACSANPALEVDEDGLRTELAGSDRNRAAAYLMRSEGMLDAEVDEVLETYLGACSVRVTCRDLATMGATLAHGCANPVSGEQALPREWVRDVLSVMYTCGMYDAAGQWACDVGFPAKSGVSGGVMAVIPGKMGIGVWSPALDEYGNSVRGVRACQEFSARLGLHVFATEDEDDLHLPR